MLAAVAVFSVLAMVALAPAALRLLAAPGLAVLRRWWPVAALPGAASLLLPRGAAAAVLAGTYGLLTLALAGCGAARLVRTRSLAPVEVAAAAALCFPLMAGVALVAERAGYPLFGFRQEQLALTVPHLHYAGLVAVLAAGLAGRAAAGGVGGVRGVRGRLGGAAALLVPAGVATVAAGHFVGPAVELAGAVLLTAGMWLVAWLSLRPAEGGDALAWVLLRVAAGALVASMLLALAWAGGHAFDLAHPSLAWMVATHGVLNALGFATCAILAWRRLEVAPL